MQFITTILLIIACATPSRGFLPSRGLLSCWGRLSPALRASDGGSASPSQFDPKEFEEMLKKSAGIWGGKGDEADNKATDKVLTMMREEQIAKAASSEEIFRKYPFEESQLPVLPDCNNYYSGKFGDFFWHQNADQVYVYIPIDDSVTKQDVDVKFQAKSVSVEIKGEPVAAFQCMERIIPDGSFWVVESSQKDGKRYVQLDLEKRFRMINWKGLFGPPDSATDSPKKNADADNDAESRSKMLEKLFAANKGMSKLMGQDAESVDDMLDNKDLVKRISDQIYGPRSEDGEDLSDLLGEGVEIDSDLRDQLASGFMSGMGGKIVDAEPIDEKEKQ